MVELMTPAISIVNLPVPYHSAAALAHDRIEGRLVGKAIFITEDPFGMSGKRVDMEGVLYPDGQTFSLEVTQSWIRVWVGKTDPYDEVQQAENRRQCDRVAKIIADAVGGEVG